MKVLWVGDGVVSSGFARCTHGVCDRLAEKGHDVTVIALNYFGDPHPFPYLIYPCRQPFDGGFDSFGTGRLPFLMERLHPDVVVLLNDPWNIPAYLEMVERFPFKENFPKIPIVAWLAVDAKNQDGEPLNPLSHVVTWTNFADKELKAGGYTGSSSVIPLGFNAAHFTPRDKAQARAMVCPAGMSDDAYIVGVVGRNQIRKRLDLSLAYFAKWTQKFGIDNAFLYLHVGPTGDTGCDLRRLIRYHRLEGRVILATPALGMGASEEWMPNLYSAMDVLMTTTQGEGWWLPGIEAMACGVPCLVPSWSGLGPDGWTEDAAMQVPCNSIALTAPVNSQPYTVGGIADEEKFVWALHNLYSSPDLRAEYSRRGMALANQERFQWSNIGDEFIRMLTEVVGREGNG